MPILETEELHDLQIELLDTFRETMPDVATIYRGADRILDTDAPDEFDEDLRVLYSNVPCRYRTSSGRERYIADKPQGTYLVTATLPATYKLRTGDLLTIAAKGDEPEKPARILAPLMRSNAIKQDVICSVPIDNFEDEEDE